MIFSQNSSFSWILFFLLFFISGCQTIGREMEGPVRFSEKNPKIEKILSPEIYEFGFTEFPHKEEGFLTIVCHKTKWVQGQRRVVIGMGKEIVDYNGWREFLEIPILWPLSLVFLPFNLLGWVFGSEGAKYQAFNSFYLLNPGQNSTIWASRYSYEEKLGEYQDYQWTRVKSEKGEVKLKKTPLVWKEAEKQNFTLLSIQVGKIKKNLQMVSNEKQEIKISLREFQSELTEPVHLVLEAKSGDKTFSGTLNFIFDDTPRVSVKHGDSSASSEEIFEKAQTSYELAGYYYRDKDYKNAELNYHKAIAYYRSIAFKPQEMDHPYFRCYLFRALSRLRQYAPNLNELEKIPYVVVWKALIDLQTFINLSPWHPQAELVHNYIPLLARKLDIHSEKDGSRGEEKKKRKSTQ